jgi:hypothetical protein
MVLPHFESPCVRRGSSIHQNSETNCNFLPDKKDKDIMAFHLHAFHLLHLYYYLYLVKIKVHLL